MGSSVHAKGRESPQESGGPHQRGENKEDTSLTVERNNWGAPLLALFEKACPLAIADGCMPGSRYSKTPPYAFLPDKTHYLVRLGLMNGVSENPKPHTVVESHPNVEKHDVRMGHPAKSGARGEFPDALAARWRV